MGKRHKNFYAVAKGRQIGIYDDWLDAGPSVQGYKGNLFHGYMTLEEAKIYMRRAGIDDPPLFIRGNNDNAINVSNGISHLQDVDDDLTTVNANVDIEISFNPTSLPADNMSYDPYLSDVENDEIYGDFDDTITSSSFDQEIDSNQTIPKQIENSFANQTIPKYAGNSCAKDTNCSIHINVASNVFSMVNTSHILPCTGLSANVIDDKSVLMNYRSRNSRNVTVNNCNSKADDTIENDNADSINGNDKMNKDNDNNEIKNLHNDHEECKIRIDGDTLQDSNIPIVEEAKNCNHTEKQLHLEQIEDIKTLINDSVHELVTSDLELMKIQAKNEIKVAMSHKFQSVVDDNLSLKNKLTKMQNENHKLSSSLGDMKKFLNEMKEKYDAVVALNDKLQEQLEVVVEQQKEIASVGKNIQHILASPAFGVNDNQFFKDKYKIDQVQSCVQKSNEDIPQTYVLKSHGNDLPNMEQIISAHNLSELNCTPNNTYHEEQSQANDTQQYCETQQVCESTVQSNQSESVLAISDNSLNLISNKSVEFLKSTGPQESNISDSAVYNYNIPVYNSFSVLSDFDDHGSIPEKSQSLVICHDNEQVSIPECSPKGSAVFTYKNEIESDISSFESSRHKKKLKIRTRKQSIPRLQKKDSERNIITNKCDNSHAPDSEISKRMQRENFITDLKNGVLRVFESKVKSKVIFFLQTSRDMPMIQQTVIESPDDRDANGESYQSDSISSIQVQLNTRARSLPLSNSMPSVRDSILPGARDNILPNIGGNAQYVEHSTTNDYAFHHWYNAQMRNLHLMRHRYIQQLNYIHFNIRSKFNEQMLKNNFSYNQFNANAYNPSP